MLNKELAENMGLSESQQSEIIRLQGEREVIKRRMAEKMNDSVAVKKELLEEFRDNEKRLQSLWGFDDSWHHRFMQELKISGCNCPYLDNKDSRGVQVYKNQTCKWHNL